VIHCGTGYCEHGREKRRCRDRGTGYCEHGSEERGRRDCGNWLPVQLRLQHYQ
jgi:hypothetical protein